MVLNIVTDSPKQVLLSLQYVFEDDRNGVEVSLLQVYGNGIAEFEISSSKPCCISLESLTEALPYINDFNIRILV